MLDWQARTLVSGVIYGWAFGCSATDDIRKPTDPGPDVRTARQALAGSCAPSECGGRSADRCWCDALCSVLHDCCEDYETVCDPPTPPASQSCAGRCGGSAPGAACYCDVYCARVGDCCSDFPSECGVDSCGAPVLVDALPFSAEIDTRSATTASTDPKLSCSNDLGSATNENTVWFEFTSPTSGTAVITTAGTNYGVDIAVHAGRCGNLTEVACEAMSIEDKAVRFDAEANTTYLIEVTDWYGDGAGGGDLHFELDFFEWTFRPAPQGARLNEIRVDPTNENRWYVGTNDGLLVTQDGGISWQQKLSGLTWGLDLDPWSASRVYAGSDNRLYRSTNAGQTWTLVKTFPNKLSVYDVFVSPIDGTVYVGNYWGYTTDAPGLYKSTTQGATWTFHPFNIPALPNNEHKGLIIWDIAQDPQNGYLYVGAEPASKPSNMSTYDPPTLRSKNGGSTWQDISGPKGAPGSLPWHATSIQVGSDKVYFQMEGSDVYVSVDDGNSAQLFDRSSAWNLFVDPSDPSRLYSGDITGPRIQMARDPGVDFSQIGPPGTSGTGFFNFDMNGNSTKLYAALGSSTQRNGVYVVDMNGAPGPSYSMQRRSIVAHKWVQHPSNGPAKLSFLLPVGMERIRTTVYSPAGYSGSLRVDTRQGSPPTWPLYDCRTYGPPGPSQTCAHDLSGTDRMYYVNLWGDSNSWLEVVLENESP